MPDTFEALGKQRYVIRTGPWKILTVPYGYVTADGNTGAGFPKRNGGGGGGAWERHAQAPTVSPGTWGGCEGRRETETHPRLPRAPRRGGRIFSLRWLEVIKAHCARERQKKKPVLLTTIRRHCGEIAGTWRAAVTERVTSAPRRWPR